MFSSSVDAFLARREPRVKTRRRLDNDPTCCVLAAFPSSECKAAVTCKDASAGACCGWAHGTPLTLSLPVDSVRLILALDSLLAWLQYPFSDDTSGRTPAHFLIMPPTTRTRQPTARTASSSKSKPPSVSPDELADKLATKLTISNPKGKAKAKDPTPADRKGTAMRAVNAASKSLSVVLETGWKASEAKTSDRTTASSVTKHAATARNDLVTLRALDPGQVDVERAASSIVGKLVGLEMVSLLLSFYAPSHFRCSIVPPLDSCKTCTPLLSRSTTPPSRLQAPRP